VPVERGLEAIKASVRVTVGSIACCCSNINLLKRVLLITRDLLLVVDLMIVMSGSNFANFMEKITFLFRECLL
jgi:hypothetical protein